MVVIDDVATHTRYLRTIPTARSGLCVTELDTSESNPSRDWLALGRLLRQIPSREIGQLFIGC